MSFLNLAQTRSSIRSYQAKPVDKEKLLQVLEAGRIAPSACNLQPRHFVVVQEPNLLNQIKSTYAKEWLQTAPAIIVVCGDHKSAWHRPMDQKDHCDIDSAIAVDHMILAATELGLGTCWVCFFDAKKCAEILKLPAHIEPIVLLPIGYPNTPLTLNPKNRKPLNEIVHWDHF